MSIENETQVSQFANKPKCGCFKNENKTLADSDRNIFHRSYDKPFHFYPIFAYRPVNGSSSDSLLAEFQLLRIRDGRPKLKILVFSIENNCHEIAALESVRYGFLQKSYSFVKNQQNHILIRCLKLVEII